MTIAASWLCSLSCALRAECTAAPAELRRGRGLVVSDSIPPDRAGPSTSPLADATLPLRSGELAEAGPRALGDHAAGALPRARTPHSAQRAMRGANRAARCR